MILLIKTKNVGYDFAKIVSYLYIYFFNFCDLKTKIIDFSVIAIPSLFSSTKRLYFIVANLDLRHFLSVPGPSFDLGVPVVTGSSYRHTFQCLLRCLSVPL